MSTAHIKGSNSAGHRGWTTVKCRICARKLDVTADIVYVCPNCKDKYNAYFCAADARRLHYRCPYCGKELELLSPWIVKQVRSRVE